MNTEYGWFKSFRSNTTITYIIWLGRHMPSLSFGTIFWTFDRPPVPQSYSKRTCYKWVFHMFS